MKLKQQPEDFRVEELTDVVPQERGSFALYRMEKRGWSTPDSIAAIRRRWRIEPRRVSYGGLKDRHAFTLQYLTIFHGPKRGLKHHGVTLEYLGQLTVPYTSEQIRANRFHLTLRDLTTSAVAAAQLMIDEVREQGIPNYFDDQRFGSVGENREFIARMLVLERYEEALKLALAASYEHDRAEQKREKAILNAFWGDWPTCKARLPRSHARSLVDYLVSHPTDFRGALARLRPELRGLYLSAFQSYLWNRMLDRWIRDRCLPEQILPVELCLGDMAMHRRLDEDRYRELAGLSLPLPSARLHGGPQDPRMQLVEKVLADEGLELRQLRVKGIREMFFSKGERPALCLPHDLRHEAGSDELNPRRQKLQLSFELPRGCYATLLVKRIMSEPAIGPAE